MTAHRSRIFTTALVILALCGWLGLLHASTAGDLLRRDEKSRADPVGGREKLSWSPRPTEEINVPATVFLGSVPEAMTEGGTAVRGFHLISRGNPLKRVLLWDAADRLLSSVGPLRKERDVRSALLPLSASSEITSKSRARDFSIEVRVHGEDPWSLTVIPTANGEGKEIIGAELKTGHPRVLYLSPRARGFRARIASQRGEIEMVRIYVANRDPRRVDPIIVEAEASDGAFSSLEVDGGRLVLRDGGLKWREAVWVDTTFRSEVGGSLGATVTIVARYR